MAEKNLENFLQTMRGSFGTFQGLMFGFALDYTFEQLVEIEKVFKERYPDGAGSATCVFIGYVLGETMVRNVQGAEWINLDSVNIGDMAVAFPLKGQKEKMMFKTAARAHNYSLNSEDRMSDIFWMADMMAKYTTAELLAQGRHIGDGWYKFPNGNMLRLAATEVMPESGNRSDLKTKDLKALVLDGDGKMKEQQVESKLSPMERERTKNWN